MLEAVTAAGAELGHFAHYSTEAAFARVNVLGEVGAEAAIASSGRFLPIVPDFGQAGSVNTGYAAGAAESHTCRHIDADCDEYATPAESGTGESRVAAGAAVGRFGQPRRGVFLCFLSELLRGLDSYWLPGD